MAKRKNKTFQDAVRQAQRQAIIDLARKHESATLADLLDLQGTSGEIAKTITVGELLSGTARGREGRGGTATKRAASARGTRKRGVQPRTAKGRAAYHRRIVDALGKATEPMSAIELRAECDGDPGQMRRALKALVAEKKIRRTGSASGSRYSLK